MRGKRKWLGIAAVFTAVLGVFLVWLTYEPKYQGRPISEWVSELNSTDDEVQTRAQTVIAELGPEAVPYLEKAVNVTGRGKHPEMREWVTRVTKHLPEGIGKPIRRRWGAPGGFFAGSGASIALANLREDAKPAIPALLAALDDEDSSVRSHAACALLQIAPEDHALMRQVLTKAAKDSENWILSNVSNHFSELPKDSDETLRLFLEIFPNAVPQVQYNILRALGDFPSPSKAVVEFLEKARASNVEEQRVGAALSLSKLNEQDEAAINELIKAAQSKNFMLQAGAAKRLEELGAKAPQAEPAMRKLAFDRSPWMRGIAINYMHGVGLHTNTLPPILSGNLGGNKFYEVQLALTSFASTRVIHPLDLVETKVVVQLFNDQSPGVRLAAVQAYRRFAQDDPALPLTELEALLETGDIWLRIEAAKALAKVKPDNGKLHEALKKWLSEGGYASRLEAVKMIQEHPEIVERYRRQLEALTKEKGERLRKSAEAALAPPKAGVKRP
jgi:HEAT repeat protein